MNEPRDQSTSGVCPECGRDRGNREPHRPSCSQNNERDAADAHDEYAERARAGWRPKLW